MGAKITAGDDCSHEIKMLAPWKKSYDKPRQCLKKKRHHFASKGLYSQGYGLPSCHVQAVRKAEHQRVDAYKPVLEKTPESPLDSKEIKPANLKRKSTLNTHWRD